MIHPPHPQGQRVHPGPALDINHSLDGGAPRYAEPDRAADGVPTSTYLWWAGFSVLCVVAAYVAISTYITGLIATLP